ncbi:hypothetical protein [Streptomyces zaomyceticus]|uniref:hypothetical protein n=1 Tax=Streptomyces zaomyceticus TaxID=68286 RepID=UPI0037995EC0
MTVRVTMLVSALPEGFPADERTVSYEDSDDVTYTYTLLDSGALRVNKNREAGAEVVYGPAAWESVQGDPPR